MTIIACRLVSFSKLLFLLDVVECGEQLSTGLGRTAVERVVEASMPGQPATKHRRATLQLPFLLCRLKFYVPALSLLLFSVSRVDCRQRRRRGLFFELRFSCLSSFRSNLLYCSRTTTDLESIPIIKR